MIWHWTNGMSEVCLRVEWNLLPEVESRFVNFHAMKDDATTPVTLQEKVPQTQLSVWVVVGLLTIDFNRDRLLRRIARIR